MILSNRTKYGEDAEQAPRNAEILDQTHKFIVGLIFARQINEVPPSY